MTTTIYTFHRASDHAILATANAGNLQTTAETIGRAISRNDEPHTSEMVRKSAQSRGSNLPSFAA